MLKLLGFAILSFVCYSFLLWAWPGGQNYAFTAAGIGFRWVFVLSVPFAAMITWMVSGK
jgi:hypothetical protein